MAEVILKRVSDAAELVQDESLDKHAGSLLAGRFGDKLEDAERLLRYAAEAGIPIDAKIRDDILNARIAGGDKWDEQTASNVLSALTSLAAQLKPVTVDSLKICETKDEVDNTIKSYKKVAIWLAVFIIPFSLATFITSAISEAIRKDIETANGLAVNLGNEVRSIRAQDATRKDVLPSDARVRDLQELAAITRAIHSRAWQLNLFVGSIIVDPLHFTWTDIFWSKNQNETIAKIRESFELTPGIPNFSDESIKRIRYYQEVRYFAQSIREIVSTFYGAIATCILPVLYALLGACAYLLRSFEEQFKLRTFNPSEIHLARFLIAAIGGAVVGLFNNFNITQAATIPPLAIAFLVGYAADVFFSFLESLLQSFSRRGSQGSQAQSSAKSGL